MTGLHPLAPSDYAEAMLRASDRIAEAVRTEDRDTIAAVIAEAVAVPPADGADPWMSLVCALAVQVDVGVPWRERFAWTHDVAAVAPPIPEPGPSSASYLSASPCLDGSTWGVAPSSPTARINRRTA